MTLGALVIHHRTLSGCVANDGFCPSWIVHNFSRYEHPLVQHIYLTLVSVAIGFVIAGWLALVAHRRRWLIAPVTGITGVLYTIPSLAFFFLLQPLTGLRVAVTTTVGLATLAFFAGAGGLGGAIFSDITFKSNVVVAGGLCVLLATLLDIAILAVQRFLTPWRRARA